MGFASDGLRLPSCHQATQGNLHLDPNLSYLDKSALSELSHHELPTLLWAFQPARLLDFIFLNKFTITQILIIIPTS